MENQRDTSKLTEISDKFSTDILKEIFALIYNTKKESVELLNWDFGEASAKGDSYLSTLNKIKVNANVDGKPAQIHTVVKSLPRNMGRRRTYRSAEFFNNEILFYTRVIPKFQNFLKDKDQEGLLHVPRHLASLTDGENDYLVLEDVSLLGFGPVSRQSCIDMEACRIILQTMAKFHAISFAYKNQKPEEFKVMAETLHETYFRPGLWVWYQKFHKRLLEIATAALTVEYPNSEALRKLSSYKFGELYEKCCDFCARTYRPTSVITQGDSWAPNFLIRTTNGNEQGLILDFQLGRCASPVLDLAFFISSCTDKPLREKHFEDMLKIYHDEVSATITTLGSNPQELYPWNQFMDEVKEQYMLGVVFALEAIPFCLLDSSEAFDLDTLIKGDEAVDISDVWILSDIKTKAGRLRLADIIVDAVERGYM